MNNPPGAEWVNCTVIGRAYQQEIDTTREGHYRYRKLTPGSPWVEGLPPEQPKSYNHKARPPHGGFFIALWGIAVGDVLVEQGGTVVEHPPPESG